MKKYEGYKKNCSIRKFNDIECELSGLIYIDENYRIYFELLNITREQALTLQEEKAVYLYATTNDDYITATMLHIQYCRYKHYSNNPEEVAIDVKIEAKYAFFGTEFLEVKQKSIFFEGFTCKITDGNELIGITPYVKLEDEIRTNLYGRFSITAKVKTLGKTPGLSFFTYPHIYRADTEIRIGYQSVIQFVNDVPISLDEIIKNIHDIVLLFEILSGEYISTTSVTLTNKSKSYDFIGNCNYPKFDLLLFKTNTFDTRGYLRKSLFKVSDFKDIDKLYNDWEKLIQEHRLTFMSYRELLLDEELKIFSTNKFLKVMQIIEGIEREEISEEEQSEFNQFKEKILGKLTEEKDINFIDQWCTYNKGANFRKCLKMFTYFGHKTISGLSKSKSAKYSEKIIDKIKNDRDTYTHASHYLNPLLSDDELLDVVYIYMTFFRIKILVMLGLDDELIRKRLSYDRKFVEHYHRLFDLKIETNIEDIIHTGEFDDFMWKL